VHLFDFARDLYGARLRVGFVKRLRPEQKFSGLDALRAQIALDCQSARGTLDASADEEAWGWI
jgi:riboflavin kinase/FMN adenylyltransferase